MPRNAREPTLARQWELLKLIPRHRPGVTPRSLRESLAAAGHEVTKRTVERDLRELSIVFPLECNDSSSDELANILRETPVSPSQSLDTRDGTHTLTATVRDSWQLGFWLLSQGPAITVLKPAALRKRMIALLTQTLNGYEAV